jgi:hypothetical protein
MQRDRALDPSQQPVSRRGVDTSAPRLTPLTLVAGAVAGDTLDSVAERVADALGCPVAIAIPAHGSPVISPAGSLTGEAASAIVSYAVTVAGGGAEDAPPIVVADAVPVRIGGQVVGIVAATAGRASAERRAWLEAAAAAASVTALIREAPAANAGETLVAELAAGPPGDCGPPDARRVTNGHGALVADFGSGRLVAVCAARGDQLTGLAGALRAAGMTVAVSTPRLDPALLPEAIREAELLAELGAGEDALATGHDETYRLLIGILLRDRSELEHLRDSTVSPLADYDARHDAELLPTLRAFLAHDGSTTETADALALHRHTVGYRLSRVHEVSGLSPYESDGRERLSLGLKAHLILDVERRLGAA